MLYLTCFFLAIIAFLTLQMIKQFQSIEYENHQKIISLINEIEENKYLNDHYREEVKKLEFKTKNTDHKILFIQLNLMNIDFDLKETVPQLLNNL